MSAARGSGRGNRIARAPEPKSPGQPMTGRPAACTLVANTTKREGVAKMTKDRRAGPTAGWWILIMLTIAGLAALAACGGDQRLSRDAFEDRLQGIERWGSTRYAGLTEQALRLRPDQPLTNEVKRAMSRYAQGLARAADQLDDINPPQPAEKGTAMLIEALRERASGFERAAHKQRTTLRELARERSTTQAGEQIDRAFEQLREDGFITISPDHPGERPPGNIRPKNRSDEAQHDGGYYRALNRRSRASSATQCCDPAR